jgi:hypothetical protein
LNEATISQACKHNSVGFAVRVKDKISLLWENIEKPPYKILFNASINGPDLWKLVQILRRVDTKFSQEEKQRHGRERLIAVHSNRFILHIVYKSLPSSFFSSSSDLRPSQIKEIEEYTSNFLENVVSETNNLYPNSYPANIFRNIAKCQEIIDRVLNEK